MEGERSWRMGRIGKDAHFQESDLLRKYYRENSGVIRMTTLTIDGIYHPFTRSVNTGSSPESRRLEERFKEVVFHFRRRSERERALFELARVVGLGQQPDWDGYSALRPDPAVSQLACRFLNTLPSVIPTPEVGLDPDGE